MRIAIAFGLGKESTDMVESLIDQNPILISCLGEGDTVDPRVVQQYAKSLGLECIVIPKCFKEDWKEIGRRYTNTILEHFRFKKKPFDVLYVGRRKIDLVSRGFVKETDFSMLESIRVATNGVEFPFFESR